MNKKNLNISAIVLSLAITLSFNVSYVQANAAACGSGEYVISAYYSPVPGQSRYATGSYEGDIRLNGGGVMTASGTAVKDAGGGFVAAPPCMKFGTKLDVDGLGTMVVLDRGGAIKGNRLDIWMGYGDEGLKNALTWGKRKVGVSVLGDDSSIPLTYTFDTGYGSLKTYQIVKSPDPFMFLRDLEIGDKGEDVARLQQILKDLAYYKGVVSGIYNEDTATALKSFQLNSGVISDNDVNPTGKFGTFLSTDLKAATLNSRDKYSKSLPERNLGRGSRGDDVKKLQSLLVQLGYLEEVTSVYDSSTVDAIIKFQLVEGLISSDKDPGAGYFGPSTQRAFDVVLYSIENDFLKKSTINQSNDVETTDSNELLEEGLKFTDTLSEGNSGDQVSMLQQVLNDLNYLKVQPSGYYGPVTSHAVFKFQQRMGLVKYKTDSNAGLVGPETRKLLNDYLASRNKFKYELNKVVELSSVDATNLVIDKNLKFGDRDPQVRILQKFLKIKGFYTPDLFTEYFGETTAKALMAFQLAENLIPAEISYDLVVLDPKTIESINKNLE